MAARRETQSRGPRAFAGWRVRGCVRDRITPDANVIGRGLDAATDSMLWTNESTVPNLRPVATATETAAVAPIETSIPFNPPAPSSLDLVDR